jgi:transcriptional regulator with XRE-family HTH domain
MTATQLRRALKRLDISQRELARRLELDVTTVNRWATDKAAVPEAVAQLLVCWLREQRNP